MYPRKRGQAAAGAAVLIFVLAAVIIGFIILIPPQDRAELLEGPSETSSDAPNGAIVAQNLLKESPGRIDFLDQDEVEHLLPAVNIYTKTQSTILAEKNLATAKNSVFVDDSTPFVFSLDDLENTEDVLLSFTLNEVDGPVIVSLNGEQIYYAESSMGAVQPISLPDNALLEENVVTFSAASPGVAFWKTHSYVASNIKVVGDVTQTGAQTSKNVFLISETEKENLEKIELRFQPTCTYGDVGALTVAINGKEVYDAIPDCFVPLVVIELSPEIVSAGENEITFHTQKGNYLLSYILIESQLEDVDFPTYYFEVSSEEFDALVENKLDMQLSVEFVDIASTKKGEILFNGHLHHFDTKEISFTLDVTDDIVLGNNAIKLRPKKTLEVRELRVDLVE